MTVAPQIPYGLVFAGLTALLAVLGTGYALSLKYRPDLKSLPGPFLASFTDLWRLLAVDRGDFEITLQALHDKYGDLVRVGPNCVSVGDPREIKQIYGITRLYQKSDYYKVAQPLVNGKRVASLFMITDEDHHKAAKRPIANAYSMTTLLDYEPFIDSTSKVFIERITDLYANTGKVCDFGEWLQWYAFDVIGDMTFSRRFGFLEQGEDVGGIIHTLHGSGWYTAVFGQMPWLDYLLAKNPFWGEVFAKKKAGVSRFVLSFLQPRIDEASRHASEKSMAPDDRKDFTSKFIAAADKYHGNIPASQLLGWSLSNINAGSDTTAISLRAIIYYLLQNPHCLTKLRAELDAANLSPWPKWRETSNLPYLGAVVKEALRIHAPAGLILERIVPDGGVTLCGSFLEGGTIVGCCPSVIHQDRRVYGQKYPVDEFVPERWTEGPEDQKAEMERCFMAFGSGKRTCIGKNISLLEVHKLVPLLLLRFNIRLVDPTKKLTVWNTFFVHQKGLHVYLEPRGSVNTRTRND